MKSSLGSKGVHCQRCRTVIASGDYCATCLPLVNKAPAMSINTAPTKRPPYEKPAPVNSQEVDRG